MSKRHAIDPEVLLAQQPWVERLAGGLVRDSSLAADLAQEAWLTAAQGGPSKTSSLRGYLAGVVRNLRRAAWRGDERRARRERLAARPEALPSPAELVERAELQRLLVESVLALSEVERTAILLHYFEGLSAEEIARRSAVPSATVRSRVHRGLEHLRERLQARLGREDLLGALGVLAHRAASVPFPAPHTLSQSAPQDPGQASLPWIGGILAMKTIPTLLSSCAALLALAAGIWFYARGGDGARTPSADGAALAAPAELELNAQESLVTPLDPDSGTSQRAASKTEAKPVPQAANEPAPASMARIGARAIDESGAPLAGVEVIRWEEHVGTSGRDGTIALELEVKEEDQFVLLEFQREGFARERRGARLQSTAPIPLGDIVLRPAGTIRGWVEDERGARVRGARVVASGLENQRTDPEELRRLGPLEDDRSVSIDATSEGGFELAGVPTGAARVWAGGAEGLTWSSVGPLDVTRAGLADVVIVLHALDPVDRISGRVLDPAGEPVPGAKIHTWFMAASRGSGGLLNADDKGRFEILLEQRVAYDLTVQDKENRWSEVYAPGIEPGTRDLELSFEPARWIDVGVEDPNGQGLADFTLGLESAAAGDRLLMEPGTEGSEPGTVRLRVPNARFLVTADAPGRDHAVRGPFDPARPPAEIEFALEALAGVRGIVRASTGTPVAGAEVGLYRTVDERIVNESDGFRLRTEDWSETKTTTDAHGRFVLFPPTLRGGRLASPLFVLRAEAPGHAPTELAPRLYDAKEGEEVVLALLRGGALEGRAHVSPDIDPAGFVLAFHRGDGNVRTMRLGPDGRYRMEGLTPGGWDVLALDDEIHGNRSSSSSAYHPDGAPPFEEWDCFVVDGETTHHDLDLTDRAPCTVRGELALAGRDLSGWTAALETEQDELVLASVPLDASGRFELVAPRGGDHRLVLRGPEQGHGRLELRETLALAPGASERRLELSPGRLSGAGALGRGTRERFYSYAWLGSVAGHALTAEVRIVPDAEGRFLLPTVPEGPGKISRNDPPAEGQEFAEWEVIAEFSVPPGAAQSVVIP